ncbi:MAG: hypothetical protein ACK56F_24205, partial [bacterium]
HPSSRGRAVSSLRPAQCGSSATVAPTRRRRGGVSATVAHRQRATVPVPCWDYQPPGTLAIPDLVDHRRQH